MPSRAVQFRFPTHLGVPERNKFILLQGFHQVEYLGSNVYHKREKGSIQIFMVVFSKGVKSFFSYRFRKNIFIFLGQSWSGPETTLELDWRLRSSCNNSMNDSARIWSAIYKMLIWRTDDLHMAGVIKRLSDEYLEDKIAICDE